MGRAAGKALSAGRRGSFSPNGERMWAGRRLVLTFLLAAVSEVVVNSVAPPSLEATLAEWGHGGGAKSPSLQNSRPRDGLSEIGWENSVPLGKGARSSLWLAVRQGPELMDGRARDLGAGGCL